MKIILKLMPTHSSIVDSRLTIVQKRGFTLIELLIVMSIIGILAGMLLASYGGAQAKARDSRRKSDLAQVKRALELVKSDCTSGAFYPYKTSYAALKTYLEPPNNYMNPAPLDPQNVAPQVYAYWSANTTGSSTPCPGPTLGSANYSLSVSLERTTDTQGQESWSACTGKPNVPAIYPAGMYYVCNN